MNLASLQPASALLQYRALPVLHHSYCRSFPIRICFSILSEFPSLYCRHHCNAGCQRTVGHRTVHNAYSIYSKQMRFTCVLCDQVSCLSVSPGIHHKVNEQYPRITVWLVGFADVMRLKDLYRDSLMFILYIKGHNGNKCLTSLC